MSVIRTEGLSKTYGKHAAALVDLDLSVESGEGFGQRSALLDIDSGRMLRFRQTPGNPRDGGSHEDPEP